VPGRYYVFLLQHWEQNSILGLIDGWLLGVNGIKPTFFYFKQKSSSITLTKRKTSYYLLKN
jgi:hypothetical protein